MKTSAWGGGCHGGGGRGAQRIRHWTGACLLGFFFTVCEVGAVHYDFVAEESSVTIWVPRAGMLKFIGHDHTIEAKEFHGSLEWDSAVADQAKLSLEVPVSALRVLEEKDRDKIDAEMRGKAVLHGSEYPTIAFASTGISTREEGSWEVTGTLTVRGIQREVSFPAEVDFVDDGSLIATGTATLEPANFDIEPVTALAGAVRTADAIEVRFTIHGKTAEN